MYDSQREQELDNYIEQMHERKSTFKERCLTCLHVRFNKDIGDALCGADRNNTCLSVEIECEMEKIECQMWKEMEDE